MQEGKYELKIQMFLIYLKPSILVKILVLLIKHPINTDKLTVNLRQNPLTLSLEENLMHRGSSLMIFFTSFHVDVKVIFEKTRE